MDFESQLGQDWDMILSRLGGADVLEEQARSSGAFTRARGVRCAVDLLRLTLAYCLSGMSFRSTSAWAGVTGLAQLSDVSLIKRMRKMSDWLTLLINQVICDGIEARSQGRLIRLVDMTAIPKTDRSAGKHYAHWRLHSVFELPSERFGFLELTDGYSPEKLDRAAIVPGEIRIGDRAYLFTNRMARLIEGGADFIIRARWNGVRFLDHNGRRLNLVDDVLRGAEKTGRVDRKVKIFRKGHAPLNVRVVARRKTAEARKKAREKVLKRAAKDGHQTQAQTLIAAEWMLLVTTLDKNEFSAEKIMALYRVRWRIELAFKRLKSLVGLKRPPTLDDRLAKPFILAHLLMILLIEPVMDQFDFSPRLMA